MVKVDTLCTCLRLAPVGILLAVHCSDSHWSTDDEARDRVLRFGFSVDLFSQRPLSIITHMFVHVSSEHLLSNIFSLASTLLEFGGEGSMRDNVEEDEVPVVAKRTAGSLVVMVLGGVLGGIGGQLLYNNAQVARRRDEAERLLAEKRTLFSSSSSSSTRGVDREKARAVVGEPREGTEKARKPNLPRLCTDEGSIAASNLLHHGKRADGGGAGLGAAREAVATPDASSARQTPPPPPTTPSQPQHENPQGASQPLPVMRGRPVPPTSYAESYTTSLRNRIIAKMRGSIAERERHAGASYDEDIGGNDGNVYGHDADVGAAAASSSSSSSSSSAPASLAPMDVSQGNFITRAFTSAKLSAQVWSATKAAEAQALLNRNMLMCGASAGICALSGFNLTYYRRPVTALCLAVPEMVILGHELYLTLRGVQGSASASYSVRTSWKTLLPVQTVGHAAHVGGFLVGCIMGWVYRRVDPPVRENGVKRKEEKRRKQREEKGRAASQQWRARRGSNPAGS